MNVNKLRQLDLSSDQLENRMLVMKKARLVQENMSYEDLMMNDLFDDDEVTFTLNRQLVKEKKELMSLHHVKRMER